MSALAVDDVHLTQVDLAQFLHHSPGTRPTGLRLAEDLCLDCGRGLALFEEFRCADCTDLALHAECRACGAVLRDGDLGAGACADCLA
ncbi:hypothetical protein [Sinomonas sp. ASV322]|uniref:hypothetical protein n=1 Tax=Sinomonas sp. ASV322 TaxID=3041920 RepID=UPI0027DCD50D|nr:hypothetical protein [Sinomonas sp. ASV322]MDQ4504048.1 hypothetical protein [Sinomonas sp. ASV322]